MTQTNTTTIGIWVTSFLFLSGGLRALGVFALQ